MPIIAVMNRKGGSGKSTLATQLAAWYASKGEPVALGHGDRERATSGWLKRRTNPSAWITEWYNDLGRAHPGATGTSPLILDTPGAIHGLELAKEITRVDAIVVPVGPSVFDRETSIEFLHELRSHARIRNGRCQVAIIGMRWPNDMAEEWRNAPTPAPFELLTVIPDAPIYRTCVETGESVFDHAGHDLFWWQPLLRWLEQLPQERPKPTLRRTSRSETELFTSNLELRLPHPKAPQTRTNSPSTKGHPVIKKQLNSPEAFVETLPPSDITLEELLLVRGQIRKRLALEMGMAAPPKSSELQTMPPPILAPKADTPVSNESDRSWLNRIFGAP